MRVINPIEQGLLDELKRDGIIKHLDPAHMKPSIFFYCGDCDRSPDAVAWHRQMLLSAGMDCRLHHIALNGGPMNLVYDHFSDPHDNEVLRRFLLHQIKGSRKLKQLRRLELLTHWPCGQGEDWRMDLETALHTAALATVMARERLGRDPNTVDIRTASCLHLHKEDGMKTYYFRAVRWLESRRAAQFA